MFSWPVPRILIPLLLTLGLNPATGFGGGYTLSNPVSYNYSPVLNTGYSYYTPPKIPVYTPTLPLPPPPPPTFHQQNSRVIHINPNTTSSGIDRPAFNAFEAGAASNNPPKLSLKNTFHRSARELIQG